MNILQTAIPAINISAAIILICNAISLWANAYYFTWYGLNRYFLLSSFVVIPGIYCFFFTALIIGSEIKKFDGFYNRHLGFYMRPLGRGIAYIFFSLMTFNVIWYGVLSFVLLFVFGIGLFVLYIQLPEYKIEGIIKNSSFQMAEKDTNNSHLEAQVSETERHIDNSHLEVQISGTEKDINNSHLEVQTSGTEKDVDNSHLEVQTSSSSNISPQVPTLGPATVN